MHTPSETQRQESMRYHTTRELGRGGMGITWLATDTTTGAQVVLKRLDVSRLTDWKSLELFEREARVLRGLDHPGIPAYVDAVEDRERGTFSLVQTLAPGRSLRQWVSEGWRPSEGELLGFIRQMLGIVGYLQGLSPPVIHRDIKPDNIVRNADGRVMLVDFGAVRDVYETTVGGGSTIVGTFGYMAPEQLRGLADTTTDLYGLGASVLYMITGREPNELPQERMRFRFEDGVHFTPALEAWIAKLVEPMVEDRFATAAAALVALETLGTGAPSGVSTVQLTEVPFGSRLEITRSEGGTQIRVPGETEGNAVGIGFFTLVFTAILTGISIQAMAMGSPHKAELFTVVVLLPFWLIPLGLAYWTAKTIYGYQEVAFVGGQLKVSEILKRWRRTKVVDARRIETIEVRKNMVRRRHGSAPVHYKGLGYNVAIVEGALEHQLGVRLEEVEAEWLSESLTRWWKTETGTGLAHGHQTEVDAGEEQGARGRWVGRSNKVSRA